jgi:Fur family transcriptional regulator, ferric uptake regulator
MERNTQQRQAILKVFETTKRPLTVNEVLDLAKRRCRGIGIATVYRNLKALVEEGKIQSVNMPGGLVVYEPPGTKHHHHFSCLGCQRVFDVAACGLNLQKLIPPGFQLQEHEILLSGLCNLCAAPS